MLYMPIVRALRELLPVAAGIVKDAGGTEPFKMLPNRLYVWPRRLAPNQLDPDAEDQGREDESNLRVRILYSLGSKGEPRVERADEKVSDALDAAQHSIITVLAANRFYPPAWYDVMVEAVLPDAVRSERARGVGLDIVLRLDQGDQADLEDEGGS